MKRYIARNGVDEAYSVAMVDGPLVLYSDLHAWALKHKATLLRMDHPESCMLNEETGWRDIGNPLDRPYCTCRLDDALREIEELI